jgi:hypothetical protein
MVRISQFVPWPSIFLLCSVSFAMAQQEPLGDVARRLSAEKKQAARREISIDVYEGHLTMKATPGFVAANKQLIDRIGIVVRNSSPRAYRYTLVTKCGAWSKSASGNIEGSSTGYKEKTVSFDLQSPCSWSEVSLEQVREAEGLEGPDPVPSKVPGIDDAELARQSKMQLVVEDGPRNSFSNYRDVRMKLVSGNLWRIWRRASGQRSRRRVPENSRPSRSRDLSTHPRTRSSPIRPRLHNAGRHREGQGSVSGFPHVMERRRP